MNQKTYELLKSVDAKDKYGNTTKSYDVIKKIKGSKLQPIGDGTSEKDYGYKNSATFQLFTREAVKPNTYIKENESVYRIGYVANQNNRYFVALLEVIT